MTYNGEADNINTLNHDILIIFLQKGMKKISDSMDEKNYTTVKEFILLGFTTDLCLRRALFYIFLIIYISSLLGNITLVSLICADSRLHTPMYFFIGNLSFLDLWYASVYALQILMTCISDDKHISFAGCLAQFFFSTGLAYNKCYLLLPWLMTAMWPSLTRCFTPRPCPQVYVPVLLRLPTLVAL